MPIDAEDQLWWICIRDMVSGSVDKERAMGRGGIW